MLPDFSFIPIGKHRIVLFVSKIRAFIENLYLNVLIFLNNS